MSVTRFSLAGAGLVAAVILAFALGRQARKPDHPRAGAGATASAAAPSAVRTAEPQRAAADVREPRRADPEARRRADGIRAQLHFLRARAAQAKLAEDAEPKAASPSGGHMPPPLGSGNQAKLPLGQYVRSVVREQFVPMARGCYEELLQRQPDSRGTLALHIVVVGDRSVGGVVDSVQVNSESTITDPEALTCLVESMMALSFDAPPEGHERVEFDYPFEFSRD